MKYAEIYFKLQVISMQIGLLICAVCVGIAVVCLLYAWVMQHKRRRK